MSLIFFAIAIQDERRGYVEIWTEKIIDYFTPSSIIDTSNVFVTISKDEKVLGKKIYGGGWSGWEDLYESEMKYFFPLIDKSDFVVAAEAWNHPRRGKYTGKVISEMEYAFNLGKQVFGINIIDWTFKEIAKEDIVKIKKEKDDEITFLKFLERGL